VRDPRVDFVSFTGSSRVGAEIKSASGMKRVALELGGTGATIVHADAVAADAAVACARNAMRLAGQSCISVQNVYVHESVYEDFIAHLVPAVQSLKVGDPFDEHTDVGTLIDAAAAKRVEQWVNEAVAQGARKLAGGARSGAQFPPTALIDVTGDMRVVCDEVFGPVVTVQRYRDLQAVFDAISASPYGLQCGIFTRSIETGLRAVRSLRVGGVIINGTSTWRTDQMPYGGIKASGIGREGPRYAMRDMTEERFVLFNF
jgi:acyl-CoA reductase-like NAD-dependent aldehyde dehydrogenase